MLILVLLFAGVLSAMQLSLFICFEALIVYLLKDENPLDQCHYRQEST